LTVQESEWQLSVSASHFQTHLQNKKISLSIMQEHKFSTAVTYRNGEAVKFMHRKRLTLFTGDSAQQLCTDCLEKLTANTIINLHNKNRYSFCLMVEASDHGYVLHTRHIHVTRYRIRIQHQWRLTILNQFSVLIYAVCHILPSFVSYQGCVVHRWVFGVPW
jgi:hypothetical protein